MVFDVFHIEKALRLPHRCNLRVQTRGITNRNHVRIPQD